MRTAAVLGSASCLGDDIMRLLDFGPWGGLVIAVNETGVFYTGHIDHWVTLHGEKLDWWREHRTVGNQDYVPWVVPSCDGSSGAAAVLVARDELQCERIVLCGVPMDNSRHIRRGPWSAYDNHRAWWERSDLTAVRSMSGWTRELLGAPTRAWLNATGE